jgi:hypothetical protein
MPITYNGLVVIGLELQGVAGLLSFVSTYAIWRTVKETSLANQASVSERLASQSFEILRDIAVDPQLYEYFYENKPLVDETSNRVKVLCFAEIMANFLEHIFLQKPSLPVSSQEAWMCYIHDHYLTSHVVREFMAEHRRWYAAAFMQFIDALPTRSEILTEVSWQQNQG